MVQIERQRLPDPLNSVLRALVQSDNSVQEDAISTLSLGFKRQVGDREDGLLAEMFFELRFVYRLLGNINLDLEFHGNPIVLWMPEREFSSFGSIPGPYSANTQCAPVRSVVWALEASSRREADFTGLIGKRCAVDRELTAQAPRVQQR